MANQNTDAEAKLKKFGARVRAGFAKEHPTTEQQLEGIRGVIRQEWEKERGGKAQPTVKPQDPTKDKKAPEPDQEL